MKPGGSSSFWIYSSAFVIGLSLFLLPTVKQNKQIWWINITHQYMTTAWKQFFGSGVTILASWSRGQSSNLCARAKWCSSRPDWTNYRNITSCKVIKKSSCIQLNFKCIYKTKPAILAVSWNSPQGELRNEWILEIKLIRIAPGAGVRDRP